MKITLEDFENACRYAFDYVQRNIVPNPKTRYITSTGNMAFNSFKIFFKYTGSEIECHIYFDDSIAPYVYYTNETWTATRWHDKKNPNEGWVEKMVVIFANKITEYLDAHIDKFNEI